MKRGRVVVYFKEEGKSIHKEINSSKELNNNKHIRGRLLII
jgi:hypothetical protein